VLILYSNIFKIQNGYFRASKTPPDFEMGTAEDQKGVVHKHINEYSGSLAYGGVGNLQVKRMTN
jgi:hypothetical protein